MRQNCIGAALLVAFTCPIAGAEPTASPIPVSRDAWQSPAFFPILPWDWMKALEGTADARSGIASLAECGFTVAGFVRAEDLPVCERLGLKAIVAPDPKTRLGDKNNPLTDAQIDETVKSLAETTRNSPAVIGYFIRDEPGARSFPYLAKIVAAFRKHAPGKLAYINLLPGYATLGAKDSSQLQAETFEAYLEQYADVVKPQFLSYDDYMVEYSLDFKDAAKREQYFKDLLMVRKVALAHDLPFWNIVSSNQIRPFTTPPSPANLLLQAWTTLAAGGRGVSWFKYGQAGYRTAPIDKEGRRTVTWGYLQMVNRQLQIVGPLINTLHSSGVYFSRPLRSAEARGLPGELIQMLDSDQPLMVGEFTQGRKVDHVILVNLSLQESAKAVLHVRPGCRLEVYSPVDGSLAPAGEEVWLPAGQGILCKSVRE